MPAEPEDGRGQQARRRRLAHLYDRADRHAISSTDPRALATLTLAHWLYVRATATAPYHWSKMASDYRFMMLDRAGLRPSDIRAMPPASRPQRARHVLIRAYARARNDRGFGPADVAVGNGGNGTGRWPTVRTGAPPSAQGQPSTDGARPAPPITP